MDLCHEGDKNPKIIFYAPASTSNIPQNLNYLLYSEVLWRKS